MDRDEKVGVLTRGGEDRLSATLAAVIVVANVFGAGALALCKALDLPPVIAGLSGSPEDGIGTAVEGHSSPRDLGRIRDETPGVARALPAGEGRRSR